MSWAPCKHRTLFDYSKLGEDGRRIWKCSYCAAEAHWSEGLCFAIPEDGVSFNVLVDAFEQALIKAALERSQGSRMEACELLSMTRSTFFSKLNKYGLGDLIPCGVKRKARSA